MEAYRAVRLTCQTTLAPSIAREENERVLRVFNAPTHIAAHGKEKAHRRHQRGSLLKRQEQDITIDFDAIRFIHCMNTTQLTNTDADKIVYPRHTHATSFLHLLSSLIDRLTLTTTRVSWNTPQRRPEWEDDMRFYGQWWLVIRAKRQLTERPTLRFITSEDDTVAPSDKTIKHSPESAALQDPLFKVHEGKSENQYAPLLVHQTIAEENQLIADIALRLGGETFQLDLFHLSGIYMSPDRMHVVVFGGFPRLCRKAAEAAPDGELNALNNASSLLSTLSFSSCQLGSAALLVLLAGICNLSSNHQCSVRSLDLSYNCLSSTSLRCLAQMLRFTKVERLSLRGNVLTSESPSTLLEFLLDGCDREMVELDLSFTDLSPEQTSVLIECLPRLSRLRVLLLEEVNIPATKWNAFTQAVKKTNLRHVRLRPGPPSSIIEKYIKEIEEVCLSNRQMSTGYGVQRVSVWTATAFIDGNNSSFFEAFFQISRSRGSLTAEKKTMALPGGYDVFTTNDPSLKVWRD